MVRRIKWLLGISWLLCATGRIPAQNPPGWPHQTNGYVQSSPCILDIDGDGRQEVLVVDLLGWLYIWNQDGSNYVKNGHTFPCRIATSDGTIGSVAVGDVIAGGSPEIVAGIQNNQNQAARMVVFNLDTFTTGGIQLNDHAVFSDDTVSLKSTVALYDCQKYYNHALHPGKEIIFRDGNGVIYVYAYNGGTWSLLTSISNSAWQTVSPSVSTDRDRAGSMPITPSVAVAALSSGTSLLVASSTNGKIYAWKIDSNSTTDWSVTAVTPTSAVGRFFSSPALLDLDGDGNLEIIVGSTDNYLYVYRYVRATSSLSLLWRAPTHGWVVSSPAVADIDGDGDLEIVVGCDDNNVYAFHHNGSAVQGWPVSTQGDLFASPVIAELDGNPGREIVVAGFDKKVYAWHVNGSPLDNWPKKVDTPVYASPAVGDLTGSRRLSLVIATFWGQVYLWDLAGKSLDPSGGWLQFRGSASRCGSGVN